MEARTGGEARTEGPGHGRPCAALASLTLALGARAAGQQSWVTGGGSYPWPLQPWADVRVQPNPVSLDVISLQQDAQAHGRWRPLGDGYRPQPGDWVVFDGHVEVVIRVTGTTLSTIGADSLPGLTVNGHKIPAPFGPSGVLGFVDNGDLIRTASHDGPAAGNAPAGEGAAHVPGANAPAAGTAAAAETEGWAAIPGAGTPGRGSPRATPPTDTEHRPPP